MDLKNALHTKVLNFASKQTNLRWIYLIHKPKIFKNLICKYMDFAFFLIL